MRPRRIVISLLLLAGLITLACGGGDSSDQDPADSADIPTATLPSQTPEAIILGEVTVAPGGRTYVIQPGDSPSSVAEQFGVSVEELMAVNGITDPTGLIVGEELTIPGVQGDGGEVLAATDVPPTEAPPAPTATPAEAELPADGQVYIVQEGDIPETIAAQFGITAEELMAANGITDPTSLNIGDELIIPAPAGD